MSDRGLRPVLVVNNAGRGVTPPCPMAKFKAGDVVRPRGRKKLGVIAAIVPPGFPPEYAIADAAGRCRPLAVSDGVTDIRYVVGFEGDARPYLYLERSLCATAEPAGLVGWAADD